MRLVLLVFIVIGAGSPQAAAQAGPKDPTVLRGVGMVVHGIVFEPVMTVLDATLRHPPVVGTLVGILAGAAKGLETTAAGVKELYRAMSPRHRDERRKRDKKLGR